MKPTRLGRYEILDEIGRGAMGIVYLAYDPQIKRKIAVKAFRLEQMVEPAERQEFKLRFQREAQLAGSLSHPNIISIYDVGEEGGISFIAMELVEGESLGQKLAKKYPFSLQETIYIFGQVCGAMDYAHKQGIVHRDLKPSNILIRKDSSVKIVDFGIARALGTTITGDHKTLGTPAYMSPEQITGRKVDSRSDIFSLGIILYQMLTGERPFAGEITSTIIYRIINEDPIPPRKINLQVPSAFNHIILKALKKDPAERYQSCQELIADIENYKTIKPMEALPTLNLKEDKRKEAYPPARQKLRSRAWMIVLLSALLIVAAIFLYEIKYKEKKPRESATPTAPFSKEDMKTVPQQKGEAKGEKIPPSAEALPSRGEAQKGMERSTTALADAAIILTFGPLPPGKLLLKIDGKEAYQEAIASLSFLNLLRKNNPGLFIPLKEKISELGKPYIYRNLYRKRIPLTAGSHNISLSLTLYIPQRRPLQRKEKIAAVRKYKVEQEIIGQFKPAEVKVLLLKLLKGDIELEWKSPEQFKKKILPKEG